MPFLFIYLFLLPFPSKSSPLSRRPFQAFPALYDWVSYPITRLIKQLFKTEMMSIRKNALPCPFRVELIACLERVLCFCHTGSTKAFATTLMGPLCLSKSAIKDGFPMLRNIFLELSVVQASKNGFQVDPRKWPLKDGYPAVASKRAQVLTYSLSHFMVSFPIPLHINDRRPFIFVLDRFCDTLVKAQLSVALDLPCFRHTQTLSRLTFCVLSPRILGGRKRASCLIFMTPRLHASRPAFAWSM